MRTGLSPAGAMLALALPVALLMTLQLAGCDDGEEVVQDLGTRAVVIGIDGADWKIIDELTAEWLMPNLARVRSAGVWGRIDSPGQRASTLMTSRLLPGETAEGGAIAPADRAHLTTSLDIARLAWALNSGDPASAGVSFPENGRTLSAGVGTVRFDETRRPRQSSERCFGHFISWVG